MLFLTRLRIDGKPVLIHQYNDHNFVTLLENEVEVARYVSMPLLSSIICNKDLDYKKREMALLMLIVQCLIMSPNDGMKMYPLFFEVLSDTTSSTYA